MYIHQIWRWHHSNGRKQGETKEPLDESERGEWKSLLKTQHSKNEYHGIQSHHLMANRWRKNENIKSVTDFIFFGSKITADGDCSHEIKRHLLLGRKAMTNIGSILKSRDTDLTTKVHLVKAMVFPVVMYGCESWTIKKAEHQRIHAFVLWCQRRLLRVPWTAAHQASLSITNSFSLLRRMSLSQWCHSNEYSGLISFRID